MSTRGCERSPRRSRRRSGEATMRDDIRLLLADVDGTLVTRAKQLTPRAREAARSLRARGIDLAITSGRPPRGMAMLVEPLGLTTPIAAFNGGMIVEPDDRKSTRLNS